MWGEIDIDWQLDPKVNILIGINGCGKTTILELIYSIIKSTKTPYQEKLFGEANLSFSNNNRIRAIGFSQNGHPDIVNLTNDIYIDKICTFDVQLENIALARKKSADIGTELDLNLEQLINA